MAVIDAWGIDNSDLESCLFDADRERERAIESTEREKMIDLLEGSIRIC